MPKRTDTTERVFDYLKRYIEEHNKSPEMGEIKEHFGFNSMGTVYYHIKRLEREGKIEIGGIRGMKKFSDIKVKGSKMRNLDAFNAMSREGQVNVLTGAFYIMLSKMPIIAAEKCAREMALDMAEQFIDWLYSQAE